MAKPKTQTFILRLTVTAKRDTPWKKGEIQKFLRDKYAETIEGFDGSTMTVKVGAIDAQ